MENTADEEVEISKSEESYSFDKIIGHIEDLLMEEEFQNLQHRFLEKYWNVFEPVEDNKLIYTDIFTEYNRAVEIYMVDYLQKVIPQFNLNTLLQQLNERQAELEGEVFEVLSTITDFLAFKEMFLDYRAMKEGKVEDLSHGISVTSLKSFSLNCSNPPR